MPKSNKIKELLELATKEYLSLSKTHKKLLKFGYNKPFIEFLKDVKTRAAYRKIFKRD